MQQQDSIRRLQHFGSLRVHGLVIQAQVPLGSRRHMARAFHVKLQEELKILRAEVKDLKAAAASSGDGNGDEARRRTAC